MNKRQDVTCKFVYLTHQWKHLSDFIHTEDRLRKVFIELSFNLKIYITWYSENFNKNMNKIHSNKH